MTKKLLGKCVKVMLSIALACLTLWLAVCSLPQSASAATTNLYASPTGSGTTCSLAAPCSLTGAQTKVRTLNTGTMTGDIVVNLRAGTYALASTFQLTQADSGNSGFKVIYQNYTGEVPIISGGTQITGWTLHDSGLNIWQASVSSSLRFRQLYVNGTRDIRARTPNLTDANNRGSYYAATAGMSGSAPYTFGVNSSELASWANLNQVEAVMVDQWHQKRARISSYSGGTVNFLSPENADVIMPHFTQSGTPHYYENAYEFIDTEGEWYLNTSTNILYYKPRSGETMSTATVIAPNVENLVTVTGASSTNMAHDIRLTGITFQYSNWTLPSSRGYLNWQAGFQLGSAGDATVPGAIQLTNANNISIDHNTISHTGAHGILALDVTQNSIFDHNTITDTSAGGIYLGLASSSSSSNQVTYNTVTYGGMEYTDVVGIYLEFAPYAIVNHNEVGYYRYTGISIGWDWTDTATAATNIEIGYNYIHDVMLLLNDGGGIYTLGKIPNMNIHDNYIKNLSPSSYAGNYSGEYGINGIYLDNGSNGKTVQNNVLDNSTAFYAQIYSPVAYGNTIQNNYYNSTLGTIAGGNTVTGNTSVSGAWPTAAQTIINNAGTGATTPTIVDDLNDWSKTYSHTANLGLDTTNSLYVGGDASRAYRTTSTYENIVYSSGSNTMTSFTTDTWFWPSEGIVDFNIYTSPDNSTYTLFTPTKTTVTGTYPTWNKVTYSGNLPAGTKYVKIEYRNTSANNWNPQIGSVTYTVSSGTSPSNLALNKTVTVSGDSGGSYLTDGSVSGGLSTKWYASSVPQSAKIDLGQAYNITRWVVKHAGAGGEATYYNTADFKLQTSADGSTNWTDVDAVTGNTANVTDRTVTSFNSRYVRVYVTKANASIDNGIRIYEVEIYGGGSGALSRSGWVTNASSTESGGNTNNAIDGNINTRWSSGVYQTSSPYQWYSVNMGSVQTFSSIVLDAGSSSGDYPRHYKINGSNDGITWTQITTGSGSGAVTTVSFPTQSYQYIGIDQDGSAPSNWWSIAELNIYP